MNRQGHGTKRMPNCGRWWSAPMCWCRRPADYCALPCSSSFRVNALQMIRGNGEAQGGLDISLAFAAAEPPNCSLPDAPAFRFSAHEQRGRLTECGLMTDNQCATL